MILRVRTLHMQIRKKTLREELHFLFPNMRYHPQYVVALHTYRNVGNMLTLPGSAPIYSR